MTPQFQPASVTSSSFRTLRLRKHADYSLVYGASRKHSSVSLSFFYRLRLNAASDTVSENATDTASPRFGITTPRALGPAVLRNRIKRRLRVAARAALPLLPPGADVVLHPRPSVAALPLPALQAEIDAIFTRVATRIISGADNTPQPRTPKKRGNQRS